MNIDLRRRDNGAVELYITNPEGHGFMMTFKFDDVKETNPEVFLIKMASMIEGLFAERDRKFTWSLE